MKQAKLMVALLAGMSASVLAADFPKQPVNLIVPFNAGGGTDLLVRAFSPQFAKALGGDAFVSNVAGGGGTVAASQLQGEKPDGYKLGYFSVTVSTIQPQIKNVPYGLDSWTPICSIAASPTLFYVSNDSPFRSMEEVVEAVKAEPGKYIYGSSGPGAITHLTMVAALAGLDVLDDVRHVPFQGSGPAMQAMASGTIQFFGDTELLMDRGDMRPLMVFADQRLTSLPDVPTASEVGIAPPLNELYLWGGLFAPAGLDDATRATLTQACETAVNAPEFQKFAQDSGTVIQYRDSQAFDDFYRHQYSSNQTIIQAANLK